MPKRIFEHGRVCNGSTCEFKGEVQLWEMFHKHKTSANGHNTNCKSCRRKQNLARQEGKVKSITAPYRSLQSQCGKGWDSSNAASFILGKLHEKY